MNITYIADESDNLLMLKTILKNKLYISSRLLIHLKNNNCIYVNNNPVNVLTVIHTNDVVSILLDKLTNLIDLPLSKFNIWEYSLNILYEDDYLIIVNKPNNMPVHPCSTEQSHTLANALVYYFFKNNINVLGIHILTRLDKNTSGICVIAKNKYIQELFVRKKDVINFRKEYIAIVNGIVEKAHDFIEENISRKKDTIILREVNKSGDFAKTEYYRLSTNLEKNYSVLRVILHTGRTHQIRVHMSHIGHTLLGDELYFTDKSKKNIRKYISRQALHAYNISFNHPITNEFITVTCNLPDDMQVLI